jgi:phosphopantothenoylcysteine decarboxylase/phosphopantothenate--cysteine ligase
MTELNSVANSAKNLALSGKKIVLGISGGIAAYKCPELSRALIKEGASVQVVMTKAATQFVTPTTMQALTGKPVYVSQWDDRIDNGMPHIELSREADAILITPASADLMAKLSLGLADDLLSTLCLARGSEKDGQLLDCPLLLAPAMNRQMWEHPATQRSAARLIADGVSLLGPASGEQACGEVGMGRMLEPNEIVESLIAFFEPKVLKGKRVMITAGPTYEAIDPVRGITNRSSGKMGFAIARAAVEAGAQVHLIAGPCALETPLAHTGQIIRTNVTSAQQMHQAVMASHACDIFFAVAAVADWRVSKAASQKIKKQSGQSTPQLEFTENPDILADFAKLSKNQKPYCVGFAAETEKLEEHGKSKLAKKNIPLLVANIGPETFGLDDNQIALIDAKGLKKLPRGSKTNLARELIAHIAKQI